MTRDHFRHTRCEVARHPDDDSPQANFNEIVLREELGSSN
jgi:hypothetical protein